MRDTTRPGLRRRSGGVYTTQRFDGCAPLARTPLWTGDAGQRDCGPAGDGGDRARTIEKETDVLADCSYAIYQHRRRHCFNEEGNVRELWQRITKVMAESHPDYAYEVILIDNASTDGTVRELKAIAREDQRVKVIVNTRNFGHIRSGAITRCFRRAARRSDSIWRRTWKTRRR